MIDIIEQTKFRLSSEQKTILLATDMSNPQVQALAELFPSVIQEKQKDDVLIIHTLDRIPAKKIIILPFSKLAVRESSLELFSKIPEAKEDVCVLIDTFVHPKNPFSVADLTESLMLKDYRFEQFKTKKEDTNQTYHFYGEKDLYEIIKKAFVLSKAIAFSRDLTNTPYNQLNAKKLAQYAKSLEKYPDIRVEVLSKATIEELGMGLYLGVNKGSLDEPQFIIIEYRPSDSYDLALVGKGVMYDTGGYSLKTAQSMPGMKTDMAGAASVLATMEAVAQLKVKTSIIAMIPATDNRIGDHAIVPDDILTSAKGLTVEIISTDAEGRLTLADALWYAQKRNARKIIDIATLTGAMVAALGEDYTGAFTNNKRFLEDFRLATVRANEPIWEMPISKGYHQELKSDCADLKNKGGKNAGASIAAAFLEEFVDKKTPWIHLDIAATSVHNSMATGVMVKSFVEYVLSLT